MITEQTMWRCSDGQTFDHKPAAEDHELGLQVSIKVCGMTEADYLSVEAEMIVDFINTNRHKLRSILNGESEHG